eukprot:tig00020723_g13498.t1
MDMISIPNGMEKTHPTNYWYFNYTREDYKAGKDVPKTPTCEDIPKFCPAGSAAHKYYSSECAKIVKADPFVVPSYWKNDNNYDSWGPPPFWDPKGPFGLPGRVNEYVPIVQFLISPVPALAGFISMVYTTNARAWNWNDIRWFGAYYTSWKLFFYDPTKSPNPAEYTDATKFLFGPDVHALLEKTCPADAPATPAILFRDAERTGRKTVSEAKVRMCLPATVDSLLKIKGVDALTEDRKYVAMEASSIPAGVAAMKVTLALGISKADFTEAKQQAFLQDVSATFKVPLARLKILSVDEARAQRRSLSAAAGKVNVQLEVTGAPGTDAASVTSSIQSAINAQVLRGETANLQFGGISATGAMAKINIPDPKSGAVSTGEDSQDYLYIPGVPASASDPAQVDAICKTISSCGTCAGSLNGQCGWCGSSCGALSTCTSTLKISEPAKCSFWSPFTLVFNHTDTVPETFFTAQATKDEFSSWFAALLDVKAADIKISSLARGSVIVKGDVASAVSQAAADGRAKSLLTLVSAAGPRTVGGVSLQASCDAGACSAPGVTPPSNTDPGSTGSGSDSNRDKIIGGVVGGVGGFFFLLIVGTIVYCCCCKNRRRKTDTKGKKEKKGKKGGKGGDADGDVEAGKAPPPPPLAVGGPAPFPGPQNVSEVRM